MRKRTCMYLLVCALAAVAPALRADVWDEGTDNDNDFGTDNELVHGLDQVHDMAAQQGGTVEDVDWYRFQRVCNNSYEVILDGMGGDLVNSTMASPALEWLAEDHTSVIATGSAVSGFGVARRIGMTCSGTGEAAYYIRVSHPLCGLSCTASDRYHIRFYDTTALVPRFNNTSGQVTVLILQNSSDNPVNANGVAYDSTGAVITQFSANLTANQVTAINLSTVAGGALNNTSGGLKIVNDAPYGALAGKAVALEPATGFTFDTPLVYKPH